VEPDPIQSPNPERGERPFVLQAAELALDGGAAAVQGGEAGGVSRGITGCSRFALIQTEAGLSAGGAPVEHGPADRRTGAGTGPGRSVRDGWRHQVVGAVHEDEHVFNPGQL
jgi:hypothetical protein